METHQGSGIHECLNRAKARGYLLKGVHLYQVLWLDDERAVDFLIDLLFEKVRESMLRKFVRRLGRVPFLRRVIHPDWIANELVAKEASWALSLLNDLEFGHRFHCQAHELPSQASDYRRRQHDPAFPETMTAAVHKWNTEIKNGR